MNRDDDLMNEAKDDPDRRDLLAERMKREALAERPPFSLELHSKVMQQAGMQRVSDRGAVSHGWRRHQLLAVAAVFAVLVLAAAWFAQQHRGLSHQVAHVPPQITEAPTKGPQPDFSRAAVNLRQILLDRTWPPRIMLQLPAPWAQLQPPPTPQTPAAELPKQPSPAGWALASLEGSKRRSQAELAAAIPPELQVLIELARAPR